MTELNDLEWATPVDDPSRYEKPHRRHIWMPAAFENEAPHFVCTGCGKVQDPAASRRGKSSRRLGSDQERRIERVYGPRKVGEFGDAVDHIGRDFVWQSKASRGLPPQWLAAISEPMWVPMVPKAILDPMARMVPIAGSRAPLVIRSYVRQGVNTRDWMFVVSHTFWLMHGTPDPFPGYLVIPGDAFLAIHGTDQEERL